MHNLSRTSVCLLLSAALVISSCPVTALGETEGLDGTGSDIVLVDEVLDESKDSVEDEGDSENCGIDGTTTDGATDGQDNPGSTMDEGTDVLEGELSDVEESVSDDETSNDADEEPVAEVNAEEVAIADEPEQEVVPEAEKDKEVTTQSTKPKTTNVSLSVQAHVQNIGWKEPVGSGKLAGTTGRSLRVEALRLSLDGNGAKLPSGSIEYRAHVQNIGWQDWKANGKLSGTTGRSLRIEALKVRLTGELAEQYDVYYQTHVQNLGWMALASNGEASGSAGRSLRIEGIRVWLVKKGSAAPGASCDTTKAFSGLLGLTSEVHVQNLGWISGANSSGVVGTTGKALRLEAFRFNTSGLEASGSIQYRAHVQNIGWQGWKRDGQLAGTTGRSLRVEAVQLRLTDDLKDAYDIYYRVHVANVGWLAWTKNGSPAGTTGFALRIEAIQFSIVDKDAAAPSSRGSASFAFLDVEDASIAYAADIIDSGWQSWKRYAASGTNGQSKGVDGLRVKVSSEDTSCGVRYAIRPSGGSWSDWKADGADAIIPGKAIGSLKIELTGNLSKICDVWYRVRLNDAGWLGWAKSGQVAGNISRTKSSHIEAVQMRLVPRATSGPGANRGYTKFDRLSGDALVDEYVWTTIDKNGWSGASGLESAFNLVITFPYRNGSIWYGENTTERFATFAHEMVANHGGNCYRYNALLYWFGKALGCPLTPMTGKLGGVNGSNHGWLERKVNGVVYVIDPAIELAYPEYDWYLIRYKDAKVKYYDHYGNRIVK